MLKRNEMYINVLTWGKISTICIGKRKSRVQSSVYVVHVNIHIHAHICTHIYIYICIYVEFYRRPPKKLLRVTAFGEGNKGLAVSVGLWVVKSLVMCTRMAQTSLSANRRSCILLGAKNAPQKAFANVYENYRGIYHSWKWIPQVYLSTHTVAQVKGCPWEDWE